MLTSSASPRGRFEANLGYTTTCFEKQKEDNKRTVLWPALSSLHTRKKQLPRKLGVLFEPKSWRPAWVA